MPNSQSHIFLLKWLDFASENSPNNSKCVCTLIVSWQATQRKIWCSVEPKMKTTTKPVKVADQMLCSVLDLQEAKMSLQRCHIRTNPNSNVKYMKKWVMNVTWWWLQGEVGTIYLSKQGQERSYRSVGLLLTQLFSTTGVQDGKCLLILAPWRSQTVFTLIHATSAHTSI